MGLAVCCTRCRPATMLNSTPRYSRGVCYFTRSARSPDDPILPVPYRLTAPPATAGGSATSPDQPCPLSSALLWDIFPPPDGCSRIGATYTVSRPFLHLRSRDFRTAPSSSAEVGGAQAARPIPDHIRRDET